MWDGWCMGGWLDVGGVDGWIRRGGWVDVGWVDGWIRRGGWVDEIPLVA